MLKKNYSPKLTNSWPLSLGIVKVIRSTTIFCKKPALMTTLRKVWSSRRCALESRWGWNHQLPLLRQWWSPKMSSFKKGRQKSLKSEQEKNFISRTVFCIMTKSSGVKTTMISSLKDLIQHLSTTRRQMAKIGTHSALFLFSEVIEYVWVRLSQNLSLKELFPWC